MYFEALNVVIEKKVQRVITRRSIANSYQVAPVFAHWKTYFHLTNIFLMVRIKNENIYKI